MENVVIDTKQGFKIIEIIRKIGIKDKLIACIGELNEAQSEKDKCFVKLKKKILENNSSYNELEADEQKAINMQELEANSEISEKLKEIAKEENELGTDLLFTVIENIGKAEKDIYKLLESVYNLDDKSIEEQPLDVTIEQIKGIIFSGTFKAFFKFAIR